MDTTEFDSLIDRHGTDALKVDRLDEAFGRSDLMGLWIADMDFAVPPFIIDALRRRLDHPVLGYTGERADYRPTLMRWVRDRHGWEIQPEWLAFIPGIVKGIGMVINVFVRPGEKVIIQPPVYHPFRLTPEANHREVVFNPLKINSEGQYEMDFENLEKVADPKCRVLILCNPHNPGGRVWDRETLQRLAKFCSDRNILVISDEIHCDLAMFGHKHIPFASVSPEAARCSITFQAPSKTFNIAGVVSSYCIVPNKDIRDKFFDWLEANELCEPDIFAPIATVAAYSEEGNAWRERMLRYVEGTIELVEEYCREHMPKIKPIRPEASFLVWLDCTELGLKQGELVDLFVNKAHLALNDGAMFGPGGQGHMRLNVGEPRSVVLKALDQLREAVINLC